MSCMADHTIVKWVASLVIADCCFNLPPRCVGMYGLTSSLFHPRGYEIYFIRWKISGPKLIYSVMVHIKASLLCNQKRLKKCGLLNRWSRKQVNYSQKCTFGHLRGLSFNTGGPAERSDCSTESHIIEALNGHFQRVPNYR